MCGKKRSADHVHQQQRPISLGLRADKALPVQQIGDGGAVLPVRGMVNGIAAVLIHAGGIACGGTFTYVAGGGCCYVFETQSLLDPATDTAEVQETFESGNRASFCNIQGDCLLMGEYAYGTKFQTDGAHHIVTPAGDRNTALMLAFPLDDREPFGVRETPIAAYSIPERVQGMCYTDDGRMVLSASSAVGASQLYLYDYGAAVGGRRGIYWEKGRPISLYYLDSSSCTDIIHLPPYSEEVMNLILESNLYRLWLSLLSAYDGSAAHRLLAALGRGCNHLVDGSAILRVLCREGGAARAWKDSQA